MNELYIERFWVCIFIVDGGLFRHRYMYEQSCRREVDGAEVDAFAVSVWCAQRHREVVR